MGGGGGVTCWKGRSDVIDGISWCRVVDCHIHLLWSDLCLAPLELVVVIDANGSVSVYKLWRSHRTHEARNWFEWFKVTATDTFVTSEHE